MTVYENLKNVRIINEIQLQRAPSFFDVYFGRVPEPVQVSSNWTAIYHTQFKKWIVTNAIIDYGLMDNPEYLVIVGFADSLDGIMFVVWEHQVSLGLPETILDQIKQSKPKYLITDVEWRGWPGDPIEVSDSETRYIKKTVWQPRSWEDNS